MATIAEKLTALVEQGAIAAGLANDAVPLEPCVPTRDPSHGDYQSNYAFRLGKAARTNPRAVAERLVAALPVDPMIARIDVAGPGFVNFTLTNEALAADVEARCADPRMLASATGAGKTMVVDYSSPNIAKRMHVGHIRSTLIGHAIDRLHRFLGWRVIADNHIGDWGTQFGALIVAWRAWRDDDAYAEDAVGELQRIYAAFAAAAEEDPELVDQARAETAKLQAGDPENRALWEQFVRSSLEEFDAVYARLGVQFDVTLGESFYRDMLDDVVQDLLDRGIAAVIDGAVQIPFDPSDGKNLAQKAMIIRKSDGASLYGTTDLATAVYRERTWSPARIVYVTDLRQKFHFEQLFAACRHSGYGGGAELVHVPFGMLKLGGAIASSRKGNVINLVDLLDTAVAKARGVVDDKSGELSEGERAHIAEVVGLAAVRYADLSQNPTSDVLFDWDKVLSLEGNTAPYLLYAYARCRNLARRAGAEDAEITGLSLDHPLERALAVLIARTPEAIADAAAAYKPNILADHLYALATALSRFYSECRVLDEPAPVMRARLALVLATAHALGVGLRLLGIEPLDRM
jgi:arginyl-tRNA synthetase